MKLMCLFWLRKYRNRKCLHFWPGNIEIEIVYTSDSKNVKIEIVYTSDPKNVKIEIVCTSDPQNVQNWLGQQFKNLLGQQTKNLLRPGPAGFPPKLIFLRPGRKKINFAARTGRPGPGKCNPAFFNWLFIKFY